MFVLLFVLAFLGMSITQNDDIIGPIPCKGEQTNFPGRAMGTVLLARFRAMGTVLVARFRAMGTVLPARSPCPFLPQM